MKISMSILMACHIVSLFWGRIKKQTIWNLPALQDTVFSEPPGLALAFLKLWLVNKGRVRSAVLLETGKSSQLGWKFQFPSAHPEGSSEQSEQMRLVPQSGVEHSEVMLGLWGSAQLSDVVFLMFLVVFCIQPLFKFPAVSLSKRFSSST